MSYINIYTKNACTFRTDSNKYLPKLKGKKKLYKFLSSKIKNVLVIFSSQLIMQFVFI